ncbi:HlyC/CorC family transporter [Mobilitalea sibirica]|uniref:HlyC/CorC family transporter n=1 Tax=Mobilitalea sibirica TaxID=1462919 RepID=A0A8J7HCC8_9FIRM|nr:hemolysin family protein [Mobilitalea sibirica]MBH1942230.1 HlyC/CorC family transporter [Mobilitalea sibirica]
MDEGNPLSGIAIISLLIILKAIITSLSTALYNVNENGVRKKAEGGDRKSVTLLKVLKTPDKYIHVSELVINGTGILAGVFYVVHFLPWIDKMIIKSSIKIDSNIITPVFYVFITVFLVFLITLFGTVLPKKIAIKHADSISYHVMGLLRALNFLFRPFVWLLEKTMNIILFIFGVKPSELSESVTEEEIISMVNEGREQGVFDAGEVEMISNIIELDEKEAQDIMTPKKKIIAVSAEMTVEEALRFMLSENYSRYPLYEGNRDNIIGILHLKDVICAYISEELKSKSLNEIAREPYFVPDTQNINMLFHDMQSKNIHMAIVIDEYGQTAGLVAMEDFIEEIVGNIQDEYDEDEKMVISVEDDSYVVNGSISLEELEDELHISIEHEDFDTLNGLLISILDRIPQDGEKAILEYAGYRFNILETMNKMIQLVRISKLPELSEEIAEPVKVME